MLLGTIVAAVVAVLAAGATAPASATRPVTTPAHISAEERFAQTVDRAHSANVVTGDLTAYTGTHVDYRCDVDTIVRPGVILGQCGSEAEPIDLFVRLPTAKLHVGDHLRVLGVMEAPVSWADVTGHTVFFAFVRAMFVDRLH